MNLINQTVSKIGTLQGAQVLVVDNDRDSCYLYAVLLRTLGAQVTTANSIKEALEILNWFLLDILICEMNFRNESIDTLTTKLSEMEADGDDHIAKIAITTWITDSLAQILDAGFEGYLLKPVNLNALVSMIRNVLPVKRYDAATVFELEEKPRSRQQNLKRPRQQKVSSFAFLSITGNFYRSPQISKNYRYP